MEEQPQDSKKAHDLPKHIVFLSSREGKKEGAFWRYDMGTPSRLVCLLGLLTSSNNQHLTIVDYTSD